MSAQEGGQEGGQESAQESGHAGGATPQVFLDGRVTLHAGDCLDVLKTLPAESLDSCVTDPPYHLTSIVRRFGGAASAPAQHGTDGLYARASAGFMGQRWDGGDIAFRAELWAEVYRVLKPGAHLVAFSGTRTYHRMACAIEDAGFEMRDMLQWLYGSGFPKSHDVSKGIDKAAGAERPILSTRRADDIRSGNLMKASQGGGRGHVDYAYTAPATENAVRWRGWGTALKPACEPIAFARKPLAEGTVAANVLKYGCGAINIDACRVGWQSDADAAAAAAIAEGFAKSRAAGKVSQSYSIGKESRDGTNTYDPQKLTGRWPANVVHDGSDDVVGGFPRDGDGDSSAARFFYSAKADADDRIGSKHPTVKPVDLMRWLVRLVTPPGGTTLDPFAGTGTTGEAAWREGFSAVLIEREADYRADIARRMELLLAGPAERAREALKARGRVEDVEALPLFGGGGHDGRRRGFGRAVYGHFADQDERRTQRADDRSGGIEEVTS